MLPSDTTSRFPKLRECAHFHYDFVDLGSVQLSLEEEQLNFHDTSALHVTSLCRPTTDAGPVLPRPPSSQRDRSWRSSDVNVSGSRYCVRVTSRDRTWIVRQSYEGFCQLDRQLHRCIYDRKYSLLPELERNNTSEQSNQEIRKLLSVYLKRLSSIACNMINCGPILTWMEMDNRGNRLVAPDDSAINIPAVAAGHVVKRYASQSLDELSLDVGDIISIIDMPPPSESIWWQGKRNFEVGFFPSECVQVISGPVTESVAIALPPKPVLHKRGKLISFLRSFFSSRPTRAQLKQTGIVRERVFGCDLGEHLLNSGHDVPLVLHVCSNAIEVHGIVDGIYRLSGVASNIQKLRNDFDEDRVPELTEDLYIQDVHCISSLLKMYFRELPNPLFTYQLYEKFAASMEEEDLRLPRIYDVVRQLPPPHYRTAACLLKHLSRVASHSSKTNMHCKNLAIVWAPNLFRSKELEQIQCSTAALSGVGVQAIITEYLIMYADVIFNDGASGGTAIRHRPKSLMPLPSKLLSLEEAQERALLACPRQKYIDVGGGPLALPHDYHTVVDLPKGKKSRKERKPSLSGLKSIFSSKNRNGSCRASCSEHNSANDPQVQVSCNRVVLSPMKPLPLPTVRPLSAQRGRHLRMAKSVDTLFYGVRQPLLGKALDNDATLTFVNPYTDEHWSYVSQASSGTSARTRTKSCNSSLSDSSDIEEHNNVFIKPLQSSPQNSLKRRARNMASCASMISSAPERSSFEYYSRSPGGKENRHVACVQTTTIQSRNSNSQQRFQFHSPPPPEVPKRSTSLYIESFNDPVKQDGHHHHHHHYPETPCLLASRSLATVDTCRRTSDGCRQAALPALPPPPPPYSCSPRYSSSPSQSDHSDEVFSCGGPGGAHPLTPICELLGKSIDDGGGASSSRMWSGSTSRRRDDGTGITASGVFPMWTDGDDSKTEENSDVLNLSSNEDEIRFILNDSNDAFDLTNLSSFSSEKEALDVSTTSSNECHVTPTREGDVVRWVVPTLASGSAFVTEVDEFLQTHDWSAVHSDMDMLGDMSRSLDNLLSKAPLSYATAAASPPGGGLPSRSDGREFGSRPEAYTFDETSGTDTDSFLGRKDSPSVSMECDDSEADETTPTNENYFAIGRVSSATGNGKRSTADDDFYHVAPDIFYKPVSSSEKRYPMTDETGLRDDPEKMDPVLRFNSETAADYDEECGGFEGDLFIKESVILNVDSFKIGENNETVSVMNSSDVDSSSDRIEDSHKNVSDFTDESCDVKRIPPEPLPRNLSRSSDSRTAINTGKESKGALLSNRNDAISMETTSSSPAITTKDERTSHLDDERATSSSTKTRSDDIMIAAVEPDSSSAINFHRSEVFADCNVGFAPAPVAETELNADDQDVLKSLLTSSIAASGVGRQLRTDGYAADRSSSCSPVLANNRRVAAATVPESEKTVAFNESSCHHHVEIDDVVNDNDDIPAEENKSLLSDIKTSTKNDLKIVAAFEREELATDDDNAMKSKDNASEQRSNDDWSSSGEQKMFCSSESELFSSASDSVRYGASPVRRKSVRELKNRFESAASSHGEPPVPPVKPVVKKRPPVAKKPVVSKSTSLCRGHVKRESTDPIYVSTLHSSDVQLASGPVSWPESSVTLPARTVNQYDRSSSSRRGTSMDAAAVAVDTTYDVRRAFVSSCAPLLDFEAGVSALMTDAVRFQQRSSAPTESVFVSDRYSDSFQCHENVGLSTNRDDTTEETACLASNLTPAQPEFDVRGGGGERCFAAVAVNEKRLSAPPPPRPVAKPRRPKNAAAAASVAMDAVTIETVESKTRDRERGFATSGWDNQMEGGAESHLSAADAVLEAEPMCTSSCESLLDVSHGHDSMSLLVMERPPDALSFGAGQISVSECAFQGGGGGGVRRSEERGVGGRRLSSLSSSSESSTMSIKQHPSQSCDPLASSDQTKGDRSLGRRSGGRVRGLSQMFEQQTLDRSDIVHREPSVGERSSSEEFAAGIRGSLNGQPSIGSSSGGSGESDVVANQALRNIIVKF